MKKYFGVDSYLRVILRRAWWLALAFAAGWEGNPVPFVVTFVFAFAVDYLWLNEDKDLKYAEGSLPYRFGQWCRKTYEPAIVVFTIFVFVFLNITTFDKGVSKYRVVTSPIKSRVMSPWRLGLYLPGVEKTDVWSDKVTVGTNVTGVTVDGKVVSAWVKVDLSHTDVPGSLVLLAAEYGSPYKYMEVLEGRIGEIFAVVVAPYSLYELPNGLVLEDQMGAIMILEDLRIRWDGNISLSNIQLHSTE